MTVSAMIGIELANGAVLASYCHTDGEPALLGINLLESFTDYEYLFGAIQLGAALSWGDARDACEANHSIGTPSRGVTLYYKRDLQYTSAGEALRSVAKRCEAVGYNSVTGFIERMFTGSINYSYVLTLDNTWIVCDIANKQVDYDAEVTGAIVVPDYKCAM